MDPSDLAKQIFTRTLEAQHPSRLMSKKVNASHDAFAIHSTEYPKPDVSSIYIAAVGKAARPMAASLKEKFEVRDSNMLCITPDKQPEEPYAMHAAHPVPDESSMEAAQRLVAFLEDIPAGALIFFAISGGTSSLICSPAGELQLDDMNAMNRMLLNSGATISEINSVRKHLSKIKGGQLLNHINPECTLIDLAISDVPSDDMAIIGSGPTTPDSSTFQDAYDTLLRFDLWEKTSEAIRSHIERGLRGEVPETIKPGDDPLQHHDRYIVGSARTFAEAMADKAEQEEYHSWVAEQAYNASVGEVADMVIERIQLNKETTGRRALVFYGESTVEVTGNGTGGRNQELALRGARKIQGLEDVTWLSAGTDGIDGPTDAAGGIVDGSTISRATKKGLDPEVFIENNDSYHFHEQMGTLLTTGATGNNVMDVVLVLMGD